MWVYQIRITSGSGWGNPTVEIGFNESGFACKGWQYGILGCHGIADWDTKFMSEIDYASGTASLYHNQFWYNADGDALTTYSLSPSSSGLTGYYGTYWDVITTAGVGKLVQDPTGNLSMVPLPAGGFLLLSGLLGIAAIKRRKRSLR